MDRKKFIANSVKAMELSGVSREELIAYLSEGEKAERITVSFEIVYVDDSVSKERIAGKEIKGVIFTLKGSAVFVSAGYSSEKMTKDESAKYCASIKVRGMPCEEGSKKHWQSCGVLHFNLNQINLVLKSLELKEIDGRAIWSSSSYYDFYWVVIPTEGDIDDQNPSFKYYVRPVCFLN